jgi:hypothetical protein
MNSPHYHVVCTLISDGREITKSEPFAHKFEARAFLDAHIATDATLDPNWRANWARPTGAPADVYVSSDGAYIVGIDQGQACCGYTPRDN